MTSEQPTFHKLSIKYFLLSLLNRFLISLGTFADQTAHTTETTYTYLLLYSLNNNSIYVHLSKFMCSNAFEQIYVTVFLCRNIKSWDGEFVISILLKKQLVSHLVNV